MEYMLEYAYHERARDSILWPIRGTIDQVSLLEIAVWHT